MDRNDYLKHVFSEEKSRPDSHIYQIAMRGHVKFICILLALVFFGIVCSGTILYSGFFSDEGARELAKRTHIFLVITFVVLSVRAACLVIAHLINRRLYAELKRVSNGQL